MRLEGHVARGTALVPRGTWHLALDACQGHGPPHGGAPHAIVRNGLPGCVALPPCRTVLHNTAGRAQLRCAALLPGVPGRCDHYPVAYRAWRCRTTVGGVAYRAVLCLCLPCLLQFEDVNSAMAAHAAQQGAVLASRCVVGVSDALRAKLYVRQPVSVCGAGAQSRGVRHASVHDWCEVCGTGPHGPMQSALASIRLTCTKRSRGPCSLPSLVARQRPFDILCHNPSDAGARSTLVPTTHIRKERGRICVQASRTTFKP